MPIIKDIVEEDVRDIQSLGKGKTTEEVGSERPRKKRKRSKKSDKEVEVAKTTSVDSARDHQMRVHEMEMESKAHEFLMRQLQMQMS